MAKRLSAAEMIRRAIEMEGTAYVRGVMDALTGERPEVEADDDGTLPLGPDHGDVGGS